MYPHEYFDPMIGLPIAAGLWILYFVMRAKVNKQ